MHYILIMSFPPQIPLRSSPCPYQSNIMFFLSLSPNKQETKTNTKSPQETQKQNLNKWAKD